MSAENELPASWATARLNEVCAIIGRGFTPFVSGDEQPVAFVPMAAVVEAFGGIDVSATRPLGEVTKGYTAFVEGDVLFAKITPCMENGKVAVVPPLSTHIGFGSTEFHVLRSAGAVEPKWVRYHLSQLQFRRAARQDMTGSTGQLRVQSSWLAGAGIPAAPIAEQRRVIQRIDELLSDLDAGELELVTAKSKLSRYRQSLLKAAIEGALTTAWRGGGDHLLVAGSQLPDGWNWVPIQQCCRVASGYAFPGKSFVSQGTAVSKISNVGHGNYLDDADPGYLDTSFELSHSDCLVEHGDVLIALTRPITRGALKSCRYPVGRPRALLNQRVAALRPLDPALASSLFYVTRSAHFRNRMAAAATQTLQPNVSPPSLYADSWCQSQRSRRLSSFRISSTISLLGSISLRWRSRKPWSIRSPNAQTSSAPLSPASSSHKTRPTNPPARCWPA